VTGHKGVNNLLSFVALPLPEWKSNRRLRDREPDAKPAAPTSHQPLGADNMKNLDKPCDRGSFDQE